MSRRGAVVKNVTEMGSAAFAFHFDSLHSKREIRMEFDVFLEKSVPEAGPTRSRLKFGVGAKERQLARSADVGALGVMVDKAAGKGSFGPSESADFKVLAGELFFPIRVRLFSGIGHI